MDFHDQQAARRWQSAVLLLAFVLVLVALGVLIHLVIAALSLALGQGGSFTHPSRPAVAMIMLVWLTMICGCLFRLMDVKAGGAALARRFGAVDAADNMRDEKLRQLLNVVAEVSIASSTAQPNVYVLRQERSINAFVLGNRGSRPVIVVTSGALEFFSREQLQAVIAHEFGHITNGDLPLNMRLLIVMGGLMAIDEVGRLLIAKPVTQSFHPGVVIGYIVCALGQVGVVGGQLISAAFSRQREYLADACAVQFTRNPFALAAALDTVSTHNEQHALHGIHAREILHLCFQSGKAGRWLGRLMATHPELSQRIDAIEPHYKVKKRKALLRDALAHSKPSVSVSMAPSNNIVSIEPNADAYKGSTDSVEPEEKGSPVVLSDRIVLMLPDVTSCTAALFALFIYDDVDQQQDYFNALKHNFSELFADKVKELIQHMPDELANDQLGIIVQASAVLVKKMSAKQRHDMSFKLEQMLNKRDNYHLMNYARVQLIRRKLQVEFPVISAIAKTSDSSAQGSSPSLAQARKAKSFDSMGSEFALLLSLMVESSGASPDELDAQFQRVLKCYTTESYSRRAANESGIVNELEAAFQTLYIQPRTIRHAFVQHCIEIMEHDGYLMPAERALVELFAASLGCEELIAA